METKKHIYDCIVVGAGPGGLACTKELLENKIDNILCIEKSEKLGGIFTNTYDNLKLTSSATFSMFSDFLISLEKATIFGAKKNQLIIGVAMRLDLMSRK